jgi:regulator of sigma E protease
MRMRMGKITALRQESPAAVAKVREGDILEQVEVTDPEHEGKKIRWVTTRSETPDSDVEERDLDPERLAFDLDQWAARKPASKKVTMTVLRPNPPPAGVKGDGHDELTKVRLDPVDYDDSWRFDKEVPMSLYSPLAVSGLGLAYSVETTVADVRPGSPADKAGIQKDDVIKSIQFYAPGKTQDAEPRKTGWEDDLKPNQWAFVSYVLQITDIKKIDVRLHRDKKEVTLTAEPDTTWPVVDRGWIFLEDTRLQKADNVMHAIVMGWNRTVDFILMIYQNLHRVVTGRVSIKNFGGPIQIANAAFNIAGINMYQFLLFLGIISVNLAVINFLPIPLLDGGHMAFLIYEKIRGKPAPERAFAAANFVGIAVIASLMIFVFYLDLTRLWKS